MMQRRFLAALAMASLAFAACETIPKAPNGTDADTVAWWRITGDLSSDKMEGRDTGSAGYGRAARYVVDRFKAAGLHPAGEAGTWYQSIPLRDITVEKLGTAFAVEYKGTSTPLEFLHQISVRPSPELPAGLDAPLSFRGYCSAKEMGTNLSGKVAVCFGGRRRGVPNATDRIRAAANAGAEGLINVDDPGFTLEPARWPDAYARSVGFAGGPPPAAATLPVIRLAAASFKTVLQGSGHNADDILKAGSASQPLPVFDLSTRIKATFHESRREMRSSNVLGILPGTDPKLASEVVIVSAHLDGYGYGEPVGRDNLYNGAFDDAAYVATLIRLAEQRAGKGFRRSVLFAVYTGEEKGLLGSTWLSQNLTVESDKVVAVINLDQLRPAFPLKILTMHAIDDTTLRTNVKRVADSMGIEIRPDLEPERNLNQRTDHWPFLRMGIPATNFVFGFNPGTPEEQKYREWYQTRYHRPQDDMRQPLDFVAARDMNTFFYRLTEDVANADDRPKFLDSSPYKPKD